MSTIPPIIHQTWHSPIYEGNRGSPESWQQINPNWNYHLWLDADLRPLIEAHRPDLLDLYDQMTRIVQKADLARYVMLWAFGGIYADMDTDCLSFLEPLTKTTKAVFCEEPPEHWLPAHQRGMERLWCNAIMASPPKHPFWDHLFKLIRHNRHSFDKDVLESTGPLILSAAIESFGDQSKLSRNSCHTFAPIKNDGAATTSRAYGEYSRYRFARHNWGGTWYSVPKKNLWWKLKAKYRLARHKRRQGEVLSLNEAKAAVDMALLHKPLSDKPAEEAHVTILVPVRDAEPTLHGLFELLNRVTHAHDKIRIIFGEGDSRDNSRALLTKYAEENSGKFRGVEVITCETGFDLKRANRHRAEVQLVRRANIAKVRNELIRHAMLYDQDYCLWLDADIIDFPPDLIAQLIKSQEKIVTADCVVEPDGKSFDMNAFIEIKGLRSVDKARFYKGGLYQPPADHWYRRHLHDVRYLDKVPLTGVGGTNLLVADQVHRAGLTFPEKPYEDLIETEAFGRLANDLAVIPYGLPNVTVLHDNA